MPPEPRQRGDVRPPECEVCGDPAGPDADALVRFQPPLAVDETAAKSGVGHPADTGWFCPRHLDAARALAGAVTFVEAVARLRAPVPVAPEASAAGLDHVAIAVQPIDELRTRWIERLSGVAAALDLAGAPFETQVHREWSPMDGASPPWCPFVDRTARVATRDGRRLTLECEDAHWHEGERHRVEVRLHFEDSREFWMLAAHADATDGFLVQAVAVAGAPSATVLDALLGEPTP